LNQAIQLTALHPDHDFQVKEKRNALAKAVGKYAELLQLRKIEEALAGPLPPPSGKSSAYEEYARMREQAKALRTETADAVGEALTALAPPALKPFSERRVRFVDAGCFKTPPTGTTCPKDDDEFAVVLKRVPGD
jgi:hypothetical protein